MTSLNKTSIWFVLAMVFILPPVVLARGMENTSRESMRKLDHLESIVNQSENAAVVAVVNLVKNSAMPPDSPQLDAGIKEILGQPAYIGASGVPLKNLSAADLARLGRLVEKTTGMKLPPELLKHYGDGIVQEARMVGENWKIETLYKCQRITNTKAKTTHGFMGESIAINTLARAYSDSEIRFTAKKDSQSTDLSVLRNGRFVYGIQVKCYNTARGSLSSGLLDAFMSGASGSFKLRQGLAVAIPNDQYFELLGKGIIGVDGRLQHPESYVKSFKNEYRQAIARGGKFENIDTNDGRLARIEEAHGRPVSEVALEVAKNVRVIALSKNYEEIRAQPVELSGIVQGIEAGHGHVHATAGVAGVSLGVNLYFLWKQHDALTGAFNTLNQRSNDTHGYMIIGQATSMTASIASFAAADIATIAGRSSASAFGGVASKVGWGAMVAYEGFQLWDYRNGGMTQRELVISQSAFVAGLGCGWLGLKLGTEVGGAIGTAICPAAGTSVGAGIGAVTGFAGGLACGYYGAKTAESLAITYYENLDAEQQKRVDEYVMKFYREKQC